MKTLGILAVLGLAALDVSGVNLPRTTARFALDGDLSDPVWTEALRIDQFYELVPGDNVTPPVATTAWVALGEREILVAFRCSDPDPAQLRAPFVARFYPEGLLTRIQPEVYVEQTEESDGGIVSRGIVPKLALEGWRSSVAQFELHLDETGRGRDGSLITQDYATALIRFLPGRRLPYLRFIGRFGDEIDVERSRLGSGSSFEVYASAQPVDHLQAELSARSRSLEIDGDRLFSAESVRAQLTWTFGQRSFVRGIGESRKVDWNRALAPEKPKRDGSIDTSLLYGFRLNWQTILYAGYADTRPVHARGTGDANREYFLKVSYALRPGESEWFRRDAMNDAEHPIEIGGTL